MELTYQQALARLHSARGRGKKDGIRGIRSLLTCLNSPEKGQRIIHVVGTNGKGSTSGMIASILTEAGYRTGWYQSPFIDEFRERIQIGRSMIGEKEFASVFQRVETCAEKMEAEGEPYPTEFELLTAAALLYFQEKACDFIVLEAGIGGKNDATNAIGPPELAVLTTVSLDHTDVLGETIAKIAEEKCGVLKPGCYAVTCPGQHPEALEVIRRLCIERAIPLAVPEYPLERDCCYSVGGSAFPYRGLRIAVPLAGQYQVQNAVTAIEAVFALRKRGFPITDLAIQQGFAKTEFHGRLELVSEEPFFLVDGSHNLQGVHAFVDYLERFLCGKRKIMILGMLKDKHYQECLPILAHQADLLIPVEADTFRTLRAEEIAELSCRYCQNVLPCRSMEEAVSAALQKYQSGDAILVCGSLYLPGEAKLVFRRLTNG